MVCCAVRLTTQSWCHGIRRDFEGAGEKLRSRWKNNDRQERQDKEKPKPRTQPTWPEAVHQHGKHATKSDNEPNEDAPKWDASPDGEHCHSYANDLERDKPSDTPYDAPRAHQSEARNEQA